MKIPTSPQPSPSQIKRAVRLHMTDHKITHAYLFGSHARGDANATSDIDIAVDVANDADLLDLIGFKQAVEDTLKIEVDVTTRRSIAPQLRPYIEADMVAI